MPNPRVSPECPTPESPSSAQPRIVPRVPSPRALLECPNPEYPTLFGSGSSPRQLRASASVEILQHLANMAHTLHFEAGLGAWKRAVEQEACGVRLSTHGATSGTVRFCLFHTLTLPTSERFSVRSLSNVHHAHLGDARTCLGLFLRCTSWGVACNSRAMQGRVYNLVSPNVSASSFLRVALPCFFKVGTGHEEGCAKLCIARCTCG